MKTKIILWTLLFCSFAFEKEGYSQNQQKLDSLMNELKTSKEDTNKVEVLVNLSTLTLNSNPDTSLYYAKQSMQLSERLNFEKGKAQSLNDIAGYFYSVSNYDSALTLNYMALKIAVKINDKKAICNSYGNIGAMYGAKGNFEKSSEFKLKAFKIAEELKDTSRMSKLCRNIGVDYAQTGNYATALSYYFKSLTLSEAINDSFGIGNSHLAIGEIFTYEKDYDKALSHHFQSVKICIARNDNRNIAINYYDIANAYKEKNNNGDALKYYEMALEQSKEINYKMIIASCYNGLANVYQQLNKPDSALSYYSAALKIFQETGDQARIAELYYNIGFTYSEVKNYYKAISNLNTALALSNKIGTKEVSKNCYHSLSDVYSQMNNYKAAFNNYVNYKTSNDSINDIEVKKNISEIESRYNSEKKDKEILVLTKDSEIQTLEIKKQKVLKFSLIGGLGLVLILVSLGYRTYRTRQLLKLQTLRNRIAIDLHDDVGSTLSSISIFSEIAKEQSSEVSPMLEQIGDSSRKMLDAMADIVWTINPENDHFEKIILRMKSFAYELLGAKKIHFEFEADENVSKIKLPMDVRRNLYLIFKEATNNMVKYAEADKASFSISGNKEKLTMFIRDNGKGFDVNKESQGNGLKNMKKRAQEIGANLLIESEIETGTTLQLILNLI
jgi:two-component system sensor histidine kinase UhpB